jgi:hypothetical protein
LPAVLGTFYSTANGVLVTLSTEQMKEMEQRNRKNDENASCHYVRDESVHGESAAIYSTHSESEHGKSDNQIWASKDRGLILRQETDLDTGRTNGKSHLSVRYEYGNVQAPKPRRIATWTILLARRRLLLNAVSAIHRPRGMLVRLVNPVPLGHCLPRARARHPAGCATQDGIAFFGTSQKIKTATRSAALRESSATREYLPETETAMD